MPLTSPLRITINADSLLARPGVTPLPYIIVINNFADYVRLLFPHAKVVGEGEWAAVTSDANRPRFELFEDRSAAEQALRAAVLRAPEKRRGQSLVHLVPASVGAL